MTPSLRDQFERLAMRLTELDALLSDPAVTADMKRWRALAREQGEARDIVGRFRRFQQRESDLHEARDMLSEPDLAQMAAEEISAANADLQRLQAELQAALVPRDPDDERNAFLEIRAGAGGDRRRDRLFVRGSGSLLYPVDHPRRRHRQLVGCPSALRRRGKRGEGCNARICPRTRRLWPAATQCVRRQDHHRAGVGRRRAGQARLSFDRDP